MATARDPLDPTLAELRDAARRSRRTSLRHHAGSYRRDGRILLYWCFPPSRAAVQSAVAEPHNAAATRRLCHALWRDLETAHTLPRYLAGRSIRIDSLRLLFAGECALLMRQRRSPETVRSADGDGRVLTTGEWLTDLCRVIEEMPAASRTGQCPRGPARARDAVTAARNPDPEAGTGNTRRRTRPAPP